MLRPAILPFSGPIGGWSGLAPLLFVGVLASCSGNRLPEARLMTVADLQRHVQVAALDSARSSGEAVESLEAAERYEGGSPFTRASAFSVESASATVVRSDSPEPVVVRDPTREPGAEAVPVAEIPSALVAIARPNQDVVPAALADVAPASSPEPSASVELPSAERAETSSFLAGLTREPARAQNTEIIQGNWIRVDREYPPLDLTLFGRPIADVASLIAESAGMNIVLSDEMDVRNKLITGEIRGQPWHIALEALLEAHGLRAIQDTRTGIIRVVTESRAQVDRRPHPIRLRYLYARDLEPAVRRILSVTDSTANAVEVYGDPEFSRTLIAYASPDRLALITALVDSMDTRPAKVSVEVRMAQVNRTSMENLGFSYSLVPINSGGESSTGVQVQQSGTMRSVTSQGGPAVQLLRELSTFGTIGLNAFIDAVSEVGIAETETTPLITANSGVTAEIMVGDAFILPNNQPILYGGGGMVPGQQPGGQVPGQQPGYGGYPGVAGGQQGGAMQAGGFARFETGTMLKVTPHVMGDNEVSMSINLVRDGGNLSPDGRMITGGKQLADTEVTVRNDTPIVIGGLTVNGRTKTVSGVPGLSSLPVLGRLFRREEQSTQYQDLIILVTPHIHTENEEAVPNALP